MNLCYLAKFGKNKFNQWHAILRVIAGAQTEVALGPDACAYHSLITLFCPLLSFGRTKNSDGHCIL